LTPSFFFSSSHSFSPSLSFLRAAKALFPQGLTPRARRLRYETIYYRTVSAKVDDDERTSRGTPTGDIAMAATTTALGFAAVSREKLGVPKRYQNRVPTKSKPSFDQRKHQAFKVGNGIYL